MLCREVTAVCNEHADYINASSGQNAVSNVKPSGTCNNHWALKG
jgi:hypothetical protein